MPAPGGVSPLRGATLTILTNIKKWILHLRVGRLELACESVINRFVHVHVALPRPSQLALDACHPDAVSGLALVRSLMNEVEVTRHLQCEVQ